MSAQTNYSLKCNNQDRPSIHSIASKCKDETRVLDNCKTIEVESDGALLQPKEDNLKLTKEKENEKLWDLHEKQELKNKRTGSVERGQMPDSQYKKIQGNFRILLKEIRKPIAVCRELFSDFIFDKDDKREIESEKDRIEQTNKLLMIVLERGREAFDAFLRALYATGHYHAAQILEQDGCEDVAAVKGINERDDVAAIKDVNGCEDVAAIKGINGCEDVAAIKEDNVLLPVRFGIKMKIENPNRDTLGEMKDEIKRSMKIIYGCDATVTSLRFSIINERFFLKTSDNKYFHPKECGRMPEREYQKIQSNFEFLLKELNPGPLCIKLFEMGVFDEDDKDTIERTPGRKEKCDKLLMILLECGINAFNRFLTALTATGHRRARTVLESREIRVTQVL